MDPQRLETILLLLGDEGTPLPQKEAADLAGKSVRQIRNYLNGTSEIPVLVAEKLERMITLASKGEDWRKVARKEREAIRR